MEELILVKVREIYIYIDNVQCNGSEHPVMLEIMTVAIQRMLESAVKVCVWISIIILHFREKHMGIYVHVFT